MLKGERRRMYGLFGCDLSWRVDMSPTSLIFQDLGLPPSFMIMEMAAVWKHESSVRSGANSQLMKTALFFLSSRSDGLRIWTQSFPCCSWITVLSWSSFRSWGEHARAFQRFKFLRQQAYLISPKLWLFLPPHRLFCFFFSWDNMFSGSFC